MTASDLQSWLPALTVFASVVALVVRMNLQQKADDRRMTHIEAGQDKIVKKLDRITPRMAELDGLHTRLDEVEAKSDDSRDVLIAQGLLQPGRDPRARTDPGRKTPIPAQARHRDSDSDPGDSDR